MFGIFLLGVVVGFGVFLGLWLASWVSSNKCPACGGCGAMSYPEQIMTKVALENCGLLKTLDKEEHEKEI